jgi:hypothetical protein
MPELPEDPEVLAARFQADMLDTYELLKRKYH